MAKLRAESIATHKTREAEAYKTKIHALTDNEAEIIKNNAEARLEIVRNKAQALIKEAAAEETNADSVEGIRRHTEQMTLADSFTGIASNGNMVVSGKLGE